MDTFGRPGVWGSGMVNQLRLAGQVFANVIERQRADLELQRAHREIRALKDQLEAENVALREEIRTAKEGEEIVGRSHALREVLRQVAQVADTDSTVLLLGETGAGKGLIAREIHARSQRRDHALICVNCAALPPSLIESELFGHEKGAFTGAVDRKVGRVELAEGGTLFLDEIGDLPVDLQVKLLRVLQEREFERVGSSRTRSADLRVIAATNRNLDKLVREGAFRRDLYYRLSVFPIRVPPLRERYDDVPLLVWYFVRKLESRLGKKIEMFDPSGLDALTAYDWPGNVRELENMVERAMILSTNRALDLVSVLPRGESGTRRPSELRREPESGAGPPIVDSLEEMEKAHILRVLEECGWRVRGEGGAAERLALKRSTLQSRMKKHGIRRTHD
jgi:transcriptional regulator with GAF, ATPase, and Fis domain